MTKLYEICGYNVCIVHLTASCVSSLCSNHTTQSVLLTSLVLEASLAESYFVRPHLLTGNILFVLVEMGLIIAALFIES